MNKQSVAVEYRKKFGIEMPTLKLARIMYNENKLLFKDLEDARGKLRRIEGKQGAADKRYTKDKSFFMTEARPRNPYNLPKSEETEYHPFIIKGYKKVGILSDIHLPYHSMDALTAAITFMKAEKVDAILLNGDTLDFYQLSRFNKNPKLRDFAYELNQFKDLIEVLKRELKCKIFFKIGNHEVRYEHFLMQKAHELIGVEEFTFENIIKARAEGIDIIASNQYMKLNGLNGIHGHEYIGGIAAPVNIARGLYLRGKVSAFQGHNHATSEHTESDMNGKIVTTWSIGCLSELHPSYMPLNKWNNGCGIVYLHEDGEQYDFINKRIYKGKVL